MYVTILQNTQCINVKARLHIYTHAAGLLVSKLSGRNETHTHTLLEKETERERVRQSPLIKQMMYTADVGDWWMDITMGEGSIFICT